jgi:hypothetical protein
VCCSQFLDPYQQLLTGSLYSYLQKMLNVVREWATSVFEAFHAPWCFEGGFAFGSVLVKCCVLPSFKVMVVLLPWEAVRSLQVVAFVANVSYGRIIILHFGS